MEQNVKHTMNLKQCYLCVKCPTELSTYQPNLKKQCFGMREVITKEGLLMPTPRMQYANLHPALTRHQDSLTSTDRRINQGVDQIDEAKKERISETRDSQQKCLNLIPEYRKTEATRTQPKKPKGYFTLQSSDISGCPVYGGKDPVGASTESYRNVMQSADLVNIDKKPLSITYTDFRPKALYPFNPPTMVSRSLEPKSPQWMRYRRKISQFVDLEIPKRYGCYTFVDDVEPSF